MSLHASHPQAHGSIVIVKLVHVATHLATPAPPPISNSSGSAPASDVYAWVGMHPILGMTNFHHTFQSS